MLPETFGKVYQALKRKEAREDVKMLYLVNQANHGDKKSIASFTEMLSAWLPSQESGDGKQQLGKFRALMQGKKLKKK